MLYTHLTKNKTLKKVNGYKIVVKINGGYYSPATMLTYVIGNVLTLISSNIYNERLPYSYENIFKNVFNPKSFLYDRNMVGKISVFKNKNDTESILDHFNIGIDNSKLILIKVIISKGDDYIYTGSFNGYPIYAGKYINSTTEL